MSISKLLLPALLHPSSSSSPPATPRRLPPGASVFVQNPHGSVPSRPRSSTTRCSTKNPDVDSSSTLAADDCSAMPFVQLSSGILRTELSLLKEKQCTAPLLVALPALKEQRREDSATAPAYADAMNVLYASCLAGNITEQLWNFTWPAAIAMLHRSLVPVAVLGFFTKLAVFMAGPLIGSLMDSLPRIATYHYLNVIQTAAHLVSAAMIMYAFGAPRGSTASGLLLQPWFAVLAMSTAIDRLCCVSIGVITERDWVVQLAGAGRPVALAQANATLSRVDLLCETAGASLFAVLLSKNDPLTCIRLSCMISICALPVLFLLGNSIDQLADGILRQSAISQNSEQKDQHGCVFDIKKMVGDGLTTIRHGWTEYSNQPVLPASLAYVLLCFNVALAPGALMTTFLMHHGASPSVLGGFGGLSALMGILATFTTAGLVRKLGILKAGAAGLIAQSVLLGAAVFVYLTGSISRRSSLFTFLSLIAVSRVGHMAYSVIGLQIVQTGNPIGKAKLIGATEMSVASLAELGMMAVAVVARDVSNFGFLALLSAASVTAAACLFCNWLLNPTVDEQRTLLAFDP